MAKAKAKKQPSQGTELTVSKKLTNERKVEELASVEVTNSDTDSNDEAMEDANEHLVIDSNDAPEQTHNDDDGTQHNHDEIAAAVDAEDNANDIVANANESDDTVSSTGSVKQDTETKEEQTETTSSPETTATEYDEGDCIPENAIKLPEPILEDNKKKSVSSKKTKESTTTTTTTEGAVKAPSKRGRPKGTATSESTNDDKIEEKKPIQRKRKTTASKGEENATAKKRGCKAKQQATNDSTDTSAPARVRKPRTTKSDKKTLLAEEKQEDTTVGVAKDETVEPDKAKPQESPKELKKRLTQLSKRPFSREEMQAAFDLMTNYTTRQWNTWVKDLKWENRSGPHLQKAFKDVWAKGLVGYPTAVEINNGSILAKEIVPNDSSVVDAVETQVDGSTEGNSGEVDDEILVDRMTKCTTQEQGVKV